MTPPLVSIVIPVRNEASFIASLVGSVLEQDYPAHRIEVIVADGMSTDGTRAILETLRTRDARLRLVDNPGRIVSTGLNLALARARGEIVIRIDGHAVIAPDFIAQNVALLAEHPEAWCVGGPIRHSGKTTFGRAAAIAMAHPLGVGNAAHRYPNYEGYVDGAQFPAYRRWVFDRIGGFDERLVRNQDDELSYRIRQAGGRIFVSPRVQYTYFVRGRATQLFKQYFQYGFWRIPVIAKHRRPTTLRQLGPTILHVAFAVLAVVAWILRMPLVAIVLPLPYAAGLLFAGATSLPSAGVSVAVRVPLAIATMHAGYGWGLAYGLCARLFGERAWNTQGSMAALSR